MRILVIVSCLLFVGCGFVPSESKLVGSWQVDLPTPKKLTYTFQKDHTYNMKIGGLPGAIEGTWKFNGTFLTMTVKNFNVGNTNLALTPTALGTQKTSVLSMTDSTMTWGGGVFSRNLNLIRVKPSGTAVPAPKSKIGT